MHCGSCGTENPAGASFCMACGTQLDQVAAAAPLPPRAPEQPPEERRQVTVLFADLSGYTAVAERMDPEAVKALVDRALMRLGQEGERYGGPVDKYIGDNVMAIFGAPVGHEDDAQGAVRYDKLEPLALKGKSEPVPAWEAAEVIAEHAVGRTAPARASPLVGRDNELATLEAIYERVERDCIPHLVTLVGEAGVGKSRVLRELERRGCGPPRAPPVP